MALPKYIMSYRISSKTPTEELMTLGRLLSEVGSYASTTLDSAHLRIANSCASRLDKVLAQLVKRKAAEVKEDLYDFSDKEKNLLSAMTQSSVEYLGRLSISELELLYRSLQGSDRTIAKDKMSSLYSEYEIVRELEGREPADLLDQLKKDYCTLTFENELDYLSFLLEAPTGDPSEYVPMDRTRSYSPSELVALIRSYSGCWGFKTVFQKLMLEQYVDYAIEYVDACPDPRTVTALIAEIERQDSSHAVSCRQWVRQKLEEVVGMWEKDPSVSDLHMVPALYAMHSVSGDWKYERMARKILSAAYKASLAPQQTIDMDMDCICTVAEHLNMSYRYSVRKLMARWIEVCRQVIDFDIRLTSAQLTRLLEAAGNMKYDTPPPSDIEDRLLSRLSVLAETGDLLARLYFRHVWDRTSPKCPVRQPRWDGDLASSRRST